MKLHLVGGFLGSGKTTAIIHAAQALMSAGKRVGVITNDQGKYLVDTAFFHLADLPAVEVSGGCFCCNYDDLDARLSQLIEMAAPDVIFAESVGSCADIVATVVNPLLTLGHEDVKPASFSVFTDARLLQRRLAGFELPFSDDVVYIYDKQIEEAGLIIANKVDLLTSLSARELDSLLDQHYPGQPHLLQTSLTVDGVWPWLDLIESGRLELPSSALEIDYTRYGAGEAQLAWLDEQITLTFPAGQGRRLLIEALTRFLAALLERRAAIGHLKFIVEAPGLPGGAKLSFTTLPEPGWEQRVPELPGAQANLLVNARVEMEAAGLKSLLEHSLAESQLAVTHHHAMAFHPPQPKPTYRME